MSYQAMQDAIKNLSENEDYRNSVVANPDKLISDYNLNTDEAHAMNATTFTSPRVAITPETGAGCCSICSCAPPLRRN